VGGVPDEYLRASQLEKRLTPRTTPPSVRRTSARRCLKNNPQWLVMWRLSFS
jgi:hypothetical protein